MKKDNSSMSTIMKDLRKQANELATPFVNNTVMFEYHFRGSHVYVNYGNNVSDSMLPKIRPGHKVHIYISESHVINDNLKEFVKFCYDRTRQKVIIHFPRFTWGIREFHKNLAKYIDKNMFTLLTDEHGKGCIFSITDNMKLMIYPFHHGDLTIPATFKVSINTL